MRLFEKEKVFINSLSIKKKKFLVYFFLIFILIIIYAYFIQSDRLYFFFFLVIVSFSYKIFIYFLINNIIGNEYNNNQYINYYLEKYSIFYELLKRIHKWKNPLLILLLYIDNIFFRIIRNFPVNFNEKNYFFLSLVQFLILNILLGPIKILLGFFYKILNNIIKSPFSLLFIIRCFGFILSILIFSNIFLFFYNIFGIYICMYIYIYIFFLCFIIKYINLKYILCFLSTDYIIILRNNCTITGILVSIPLRYKLKIFKKKDMNIISSVFKMELEEGFYKYWEYQKRNKFLFFQDIWKEKKNKPSYFLYMNIINWLSPRSFVNIEKNVFSFSPADNITNILYYKYKAKNLNIILLDEISKNLDYLYKIDLLKLRLLLFMLWDIDDYIGNNNWDYITYYKNEKNQYVISPNDKIYNFLDFYNFKVEDNKKNLFFYDLEVNMDFFDNLYKLLEIIPITENPFNFYVAGNFLYNHLNRNMYVYLTDFYREPNRPDNWTWNRDCENNNIDVNNIPIIEYEIKEWIIKFLKETRDEWILLSKNEKDIEERNWRLLKEIEALLLR